MNTHDTIHGAGDELGRGLAERGFAEVALEPGNVTRYEVVVVQRDDGSVLVALPILGVAYPFSSVPHFSYVQEKLGLSQPDAVVLVELIGATLAEADRLGLKGVTPW